MNKRAAFFTLIAIAILSLFAFSYSFYSLSTERHSVESRIESLNRHILSMQEDFRRKVYITSFRIIFIYERNIAKTGEYADISTFDELFFNGTIDGEIDPDDETLLHGVLFEDIISSLNESANELNLIIDFTNPEVLITQEDPWNVKVVLSGNLEINDLSGLASWNKSTEIVSYISIHHFEDPIYIVNTLGLIPRKFVQTPYTFSDSDLTNLTLHLENNYYVASTNAPSFLNRLQGDFSADENGIESLVHLPELTSQGFSVRDKSIVDYIYFSEFNPEASHITGMPSWVKLDDNSLQNYNLA